MKKKILKIFQNCWKTVPISWILWIIIKFQKKKNICSSPLFYENNIFPWTTNVKHSIRKPTHERFFFVNVSSTMFAGKQFDYYWILKVFNAKTKWQNVNLWKLSMKQKQAEKEKRKANELKFNNNCFTSCGEFTIMLICDTWIN